MTTRSILILEHGRRWTPELQRQFADEDVAVRGCRAAADMSVVYAAGERSLAIVDLVSAAAQSRAFFSALVDRGTHSPVIAIGSPGAAELEWVVRELGSDLFLPESVQGEDLAAACRKFWSSQKR